MDDTLNINNPESKKFILIPEDILLEWIHKYTQEQIDSDEEILSRVRAYRKVHIDGLLLYQEELCLSNKNPELFKFKKWIES